MRLGKLLGLLASGVLILGCVPQPGGGQKTVPQDAQLKYQLGLNYLNEGKTPQAIKELLSAQGIDGKNADIEHALGLAYQQKQMYDKAIEQYNKALELNPKLTEARNNKGTALLAKSEFDEAIGQFELCMKDPEYPTPDKALYNIGVAFFSKGDVDKAMTYYQQALGPREENINALFNLAYCYETKKNYAKALDLYKKAVGVDPTFKDAYYRMAIVLNEREEYRPAAEHLQNVLKYDNSNLAAQFLLGQIYMKMGNVDAGVRQLHAVAKAEPTSELAQKAMEEISQSKVQVTAKRSPKTDRKR
jgi:type IV pilus biogenesis/stability protein PilW